jgi:hypothetical protein
VCAAEVNVVNPQRAGLILEVTGPVPAGTGDVFIAVLEDHVVSTPNRDLAAQVKDNRWAIEDVVLGLREVQRAVGVTERDRRRIGQVRLIPIRERAGLSRGGGERRAKETEGAEKRGECG